MSSTLGKNLEISIFGESHGDAIGVVISGLPSGEVVDKDIINRYLKKRATADVNTFIFQNAITQTACHNHRSCKPA